MVSDLQKLIIVCDWVVKFIYLNCWVVIGLQIIPQFFYYNFNMADCEWLITTYT